MNVLAAVDTHWHATAHGPRARSAIVAWAQRCPEMGAHLSPAELVATINQPGHPERSCRLLADLVLLADDDTLARLAVLQAILPGLRRAIRQRWNAAASNGPWSTHDDLAADAISLAWESIGHHAGRAHPLPARLILRQVERRLRTVHDAHRREWTRGVPITDIQPEVTGEGPDNGSFADQLRRAVDRGELDSDEAGLAYRVGVLNEPAATAGRRYDLKPGQVRDSLQAVLDVLAGATGATSAKHQSRHPTVKSTGEVHLVPSTHPPGDRGTDRSPTPALIPLLLTVNQAAQLLGIGRSTLYELLEAGDIRSVKVGASRRIPIKAVHEYIDRLMGQDDKLVATERVARPGVDKATAATVDRSPPGRRLNRRSAPHGNPAAQISLFPTVDAEGA